MRLSDVPSDPTEQAEAGRWLFQRASYPPELATDPATAAVLVEFWS